jgi:hypothetical protein
MVDVNYSPGARILVRNAEWLVRNATRNSTGGRTLYCVGLSEIVKDQEFIFLTNLENNIEIIDPFKTKFRHNDSKKTD